jgi:chromosome segregation ATPase
VLLCSNEQLALRSDKVVDLTSWCMGLKEEGLADRTSVHRLVDGVRHIKAEADKHEEEMRQMKGNLQALMVEWDKSQCQDVEASLRVDSLSKHLEGERSEGRALKARIGGILRKSCLVF